MQNNVVYSPVMLYDYASMKSSFTPIGSNLFQRDGVYYSSLDLNGSRVLQPIGEGGDQGFFGAFSALTDSERSTLATHLLGRVGSSTVSAEGETADAVRFLLGRMTEGDVEKNPEEWRALSAMVAADPTLKPPDATDTLTRLDKFLSAAPPPAAPSTEGSGHKDAAPPTTK